MLEFCGGGSLDSALYGERAVELTEEDILTIAAGCAAGLAHLHAENIVHRDIATRNVLLIERTFAKLTDFGMARIDVAPDADATTKTLVGPIRNMSPEQMADSVVSSSADVWAFGVLLFECATRSRPWSDVPQGKELVVASRVMGGEHLPVPPTCAFADTMRACFAREPSSRPAMTNVVEELTRLRKT